MPTDSVSYRDSLIQIIGILASAREQLDYERNVPIAYVPDELVCQFFDDHYHPKSLQFIAEFSQKEMIEIGVFSGFLEMASGEVRAAKKPVVSAVLKLPSWRTMMKRARATVALLKQGATEQIETEG